jgi:hypothetical protein
MEQVLGRLPEWMNQGWLIGVCGGALVNEAHAIKCPGW